jgi:hypothetical protein
MNFECANMKHENLVTEFCEMYYPQSHKWYYLSDQQIHELCVFKQS